MKPIDSGPEDLPPIDNELETLAVPDQSAPRRSSTSEQLPDTIDGYRILGLLGEGAMGKVYEAEQQYPKRRVAIKVMHRHHLVDDLHARMFLREVETLGRLKHPNIAAIYESGHTDDGRDYFAMELVRGLTLGRGFALHTAGECRLRLGRIDQAQPDLEEAYRIMSTRFGPEHPKMAQLLGMLVEVTERRGRPEEAAGWQAILDTAV